MGAVSAVSQPPLRGLESAGCGSGSPPKEMHTGAVAEPATSGELAVVAAAGVFSPSNSRKYALLAPIEQIITFDLGVENVVVPEVAVAEIELNFVSAGAWMARNASPRASRIVRRIVSSFVMASSGRPGPLPPCTWPESCTAYLPS